jgi:hypothetical protein
VISEVPDPKGPVVQVRSWPFGDLVASKVRSGVALATHYIYIHLNININMYIYIYINLFVYT